MKNSLLIFALLVSAPALYASTSQAAPVKATNNQEDLNTRLAKALIQKDLAQVKGLLALGASPNAEYFSLEEEAVHSMLYLAISSQELALVQALVEAGANVNENVRHSSSLRPMHLLAQTQNIPILQYLVQKGMDVNQRNYLQETALMKLRMSSQVAEFVKALIAAGADVNARDRHGNTALVIILSPSLTGGNAQVRLQVFEALIQGGADLNTGRYFANQSFADMSTLAYAVSVENLETVKMFVEAGARAWPQESLLSIAAQKRKLGIVEYLVGLGATDIDRAFFAAATTSNIGYKYVNHPMEVEEFLLKQGANPHFIDPQTGLGVLHVLSSGAIGGDSGQLQWLLEQGLDPNLKSLKDQQTPLVYMIKYWFDLGWSKYYRGELLLKEIERITRFFEILKRAPGFDINLPATKTNYTALQHVVQGTARPVYRLELVKLLVESGADTTLRTPSGDSLMDLAKKSGTDRYRVIDYLTSIGVQ